MKPDLPFGTLRRVCATFLASLALLCAQLAAQPALASPKSEPAVVAASKQLSVARLSTGLILLKAERAGHGGKSIPGLDLLIPLVSTASLPERANGLIITSETRIQAARAPLGYRARAPPAARRHTLHSNLI